MSTGTRRIRVRGNDQRAVLAIGAAAGAGLAWSGLSPTGSTVVDWILLVLASTGAVWASASAPWWALSALAGIAAALAPPLWPLLIGLAVFALSLAVGLTRRSQPVERAAVAGASILVLAMTRELGWFGVSSAVAIALALAVAALGLWRRPGKDRRIALFLLGAASTIVAIGVIGIAAAAAAARPDLTEGNRAARQGLRELKAGEFELARTSFDRAADAFDRAHEDLGAPWAQPARLVPVVSQHRHAGVELSSAAAEATRTIERQVGRVDVDALRINGGRIDVDAVRNLQSPMSELQSALHDLDDAVADSRNPWLVAPVRRQLDELAAEIADQRQVGDKAVAALEVAPAMLGGDGQRVYLVMFTTPAEARGWAGFMGNWAELTIDDGVIEMTASGTDEDLNGAGDRPRELIDAPEDWMVRYGDFGYRDGPEGKVGEMPWKNITMSPHFPSTGQVAAELYPQSGGRPVDGVFSLDVFAVEQLVGLVGPFEIEGVPEPLTDENTARFLLYDQYRTHDQAARIDMLEVVARDMLLRLLADSPDPLELGRAMAPTVREARSLAWSPVPAEQELFATVGMTGELLDERGGADGYAVTVANVGGSKIDSFLERDLAVTRVDGPNGPVDELTITLHNAAPTSGYPDYVIGNLLGLPAGSSRLFLTVSTSATLLDATLGGEPVPMPSSTEAGLNAYSAVITIASDGTKSLTLRLAPIAPELEPVLDEQPLVRPATWSFTVR